MRILSCTVGGFRNVRRTTFELGGIVPLVANNNYGKTNAIDGIALGLGFLRFSPEQREALMAMPSLMPLLNTNEHDHFFFEVVFDDPDLGPSSRVAYGYEFAWATNDVVGGTTDAGRIVDEWLRIPNSPGSRPRNYLKRAAHEYYGSRTSWQPRSLAFSDTQLMIDLLHSDDDLDIAPAMRDVRGLNLRGVQSLDPKREGFLSSDPIAYGASHDSFDDKTEIPELLNNIKTLSEDAYEEFLDNVYTLFPSFDRFYLERIPTSQEVYKTLDVFHNAIESAAAKGRQVPFTIRDDRYRIIVKDRNLNQPLYLSSMSNGTARVILLLAFAACARFLPRTVMAIEELETSIHPNLMRDLLAAIEDGRGDTPYLVTSHSPLMVQYFDLKRVYVGLPNDEGVADFRRLTKSGLRRLERGAWDHGMSRSDYLFQLLSDESAPGRLEPYLADRKVPARATS